MGRIGLSGGFRSARACLIHRNHDAFVACKEMFETEDRAPFVLDIMPSGHRDIRMTQHRACSEKTVARVDLAAELFAQRMKRRSRNDALRAKPSDQLSELTAAAVALEGRVQVWLVP
jgi:hypothetical protein